MDPFRPRWRAMDPAKRREAERYAPRAPTSSWSLPPPSAPPSAGASRLGPPNPTPSLASSPPSQPPATPPSSNLLNRPHPRDPCSPAFADAARLVADAWAFLSDPDRKASLDSAYEAFEAAATPVPTAPYISEEMPKRPIGQKVAKEAALAAKRRSKRFRSDDDDDGNSKESVIDLDKLDRFSKSQEETNAKRIKVLELQKKLLSEKLETTKLAHLTAQETKEGKKKAYFRGKEG
ncbi:unnamed protein product [Miscanthus lutarioriparius]|uniref:Uncharacterized protein n=1 Tax=Miscanthus lutarioriparius TaxID=422564 RepID=A0A811NN91_9POAL|nr:unnamed protein product [Miscanthus lutarioriparius]